MTGAADSLGALEREITALLAVLEVRAPDPRALEGAAERLAQCALDSGGARADAATLTRLATLNAVALDLARRATACARRDLERTRRARRARPRRDTPAPGRSCDVAG